MAKYLRYMGEFLSRASVVWRVEILQEADGPFASVGSLTFEADEALVIEWDRKGKDEVICGSTATLRIESPGDRTYEDLYAIAPGRIRMDVYRENSLYWSGTLDPEFYEEPYEKAAHYVVSLTFSDFGVLDRLPYDLAGMRTIEEIVRYALERTQINYSDVEHSGLTTTYFDDGTTKADISAISVRSDNFYDEDGEACTLQETLEGVLRPLALRMVQRGGRVWVYDLNGLYHNADIRQIEWDGDSSTMGTDKVYNNAKISFSPYASAELMNGEVTFNTPYSSDKTNLQNNRTTDGEYFSYYPDYNPDHTGTGRWDYDLINFTIFLGEGEGLAYLNPRARYFHILPMVGGPSECDGVAWGFRTGGHGALTAGWPVQWLNKTAKASDSVLMRTERVFIPKLQEKDSKDYYIRLSLEMLLDARYNPFTSDGNGYNEDDNYTGFKEWTGWAFVPIAVTLYDNEGNAVCHYDNKEIATKAALGHLAAAKGKWVEGPASFGDAWLEYYDVNDLKTSAGILGWNANRHCIGRPDNPGRFSADHVGAGKVFYLYDSFKKMADGEYIPYPTEGGYLEVTVYTGVNCYDYGEGLIMGGFLGIDLSFDTTDKWDKKKLYEKVRWHLYKAPKLEVVKNTLVFDSAELDDVEYNGYINADAKDPIEKDTICGTSDKVCPTAKGVYFRASDNLQLQKLMRAGVTDHPENLLIGTYYSQFADRKTTLSGECRIDSGGVAAYKEANQGEKKFLLAGEVQDVIADTTEAAFIEFNPDEYEAENG